MGPPRGRGGGSRGRGGRGGGRGRGGGGYDAGPPDRVVEIGTFVFPSENELLCKVSTSDKIPYFNAPIYLENKSKIGKIEEVNCETLYLQS